jgi:acyl-CoA synthetase (AMP-forming)/AMP-acid ligase II/flavin-dependent dehydrogenase
MNLYSEIAESCKKHSEQYVFDDALTYGELLQRVENSSFDIPRGGLVLAEMSSGVDFVICLLSSLRQGLIFCPVAPESADFENAYEVLKPNLIIRSSKISIVHQSLDERICEICPDGGFVRFTSGTTGDAKGVLISSRSAFERITLAEKSFKLCAGEKVLFLMSMPYHFVTSLLMMLKNGVCFSEDYENISVIYATPFHFPNLISVSLPQLRLAVSTSTHLPQKVAEDFASKHKRNISQSFGIIEVGLPLGDFEGRVPHSVGRILEGYELGLLDSTEDNQGTLAFKGPGLFDAYLGPFQRREEVLVDGWFKTGDIARQDAEGNVVILGRSSSAIHLAGFKVFPEDIENVLLQFPGMKEVQVGSEPHDIYGNTIFAKLVADTELNQKELRRFCKARLGIVKTPKRFEQVARLAKTSTGKLLRKKQESFSVIGGGISGCTVGTLLSRAGFDVTIYDNGKRPELVVGESLIPSVVESLQRLGLEEEVKSYSMRKPGATVRFDRTHRWDMNFSSYESNSYAYNVPRVEFDQSFQRMAADSGCTFEKKNVGADILSSNTLVIDATGRSRMLARALNIGADEGQRKDVALFAHFDRAELEIPGALHMDVGESAWFWRIPLPGKVSVGFVAQPELLRSHGRTAEEQFDALLAKELGQYLQGAQRISKVMKYSNYQLVNNRLYGPGWACVGDAAGFADPVFSSGVAIALGSAERLANHIISNGWCELETYEQQVKKELSDWRRLIESFYGGSFRAMVRFGAALDEERLMNFRALVSQIMSGYADDSALDSFFGILNYCQRAEVANS